MFQIKVQVKTGTSQEKLEVKGNEALVWIRQKPIAGQANAVLLRVLAKHFGVKKSAVSIQSGLKSKHKVVVIDDKA